MFKLIKESSQLSFSINLTKILTLHWEEFLFLTHTFYKGSFLSSVIKAKMKKLNLLKSKNKLPKYIKTHKKLSNTLLDSWILMMIRK
jgi:hypothetical protein